MELQTERLSLRPWNTEEYLRLYELAKDPEVGPRCGWPPHQSPEESRLILEKVLYNDYTWAIIRKEDGLLIGNISLMPAGVSRIAENDREAEVGYWLGRPYWNDGYMSEACARVLRYGFEQLSLEVIRASHSEKNPASGRVQEKCGMSLCGTRPALYSGFTSPSSNILRRITREEWQKHQ